MPADLAQALNRLADLLEAQRPHHYEMENVKRWSLGPGGRSGNCENCVEANDLGWIGDDEVYDMFDEDLDGPPGHPNCGCSLEYKEKRVRVYD